MKKTIITYHVFTNNMDDWFDDYSQAREQYQEWKKEYGTARLYEEKYMKNDKDLIEENCLLSYGNYPY